MKRFTFLIAAAVLASAPAYAAETADYAVGPQYDTTHVYVPQEQFDTFVSSFVATFGGTTSKQGEFQVTPTKSLTKSQLVLTPSGTVSVFGFKTPIPYPFGDERTGYLVTDIDAERVKRVAHEFGARPVEPDAIYGTQADIFARQLQSRLLSALSSQIVDAIFGENPQESGTISFGGQTIDFSRGLEEVTLNITNDETGEVTTIVIPTFIEVN